MTDKEFWQAVVVACMGRKMMSAAQAILYADEAYNAYMERFKPR